MFTDKTGSFRGLFTDDDAPGLFQHDAEQGADSGGTGPDDEDGVVFGNFRDAGSPEACCEEVADE